MGIRWNRDLTGAPQCHDDLKKWVPFRTGAGAHPASAASGKPVEQCLVLVCGEQRLLVKGGAVGFQRVPTVGAVLKMGDQCFGGGKSRIQLFTVAIQAAGSPAAEVVDDTFTAFN